MKKSILKFSLMSIIAILFAGFSSCKKDKDPDPEPVAKKTWKDVANKMDQTEQQKNSVMTSIYNKW